MVCINCFTMLDLSKRRSFSYHIRGLVSKWYISRSALIVALCLCAIAVCFQHNGKRFFRILTTRIFNNPTRSLYSHHMSDSLRTTIPHVFQSEGLAQTQNPLETSACSLFITRIIITIRLQTFIHRSCASVQHPLTFNILMYAEKLGKRQIHPLAARMCCKNELS